MYSIRKIRKVSLFRNLLLAVLLSVVCSLLTASPAAYAGGGYALEFDGVDDYVDAENIYKKLSQLTVEFWMKRPESTSDVFRHLLGNNNSHSYVQPISASKEGFRFLKRTANVGNLQFRVYEAEHSAGNYLSINTCPNNEWVHIAGVFDAASNVMKLYVNGVEEASADVGRAAHSGVGTRFRIGRNTGGEMDVPGTKVDEVRIWNYARTQKHIQEYMSLGLSGGEEGLVGYWKLNEGSGITVFDSSPNKNHATIAGATWTTDAAPVTAYRWFAYRPGPASEATDVPRDVVLSWATGLFANTHDVYFGTVFNDVNDASRANPRGVLASFNQDANTYNPGRLDFSQTYYWRVDEVNAPPDLTIFKGDVWQLTVEPLAYPIAGTSITATASSSNSPNEGPQNTINGSGLDVNDLHSAANTSMWLSSITGPQPTWIQYEFERAYKLHQMLVWNHNSSLESVLGFGIKDVTIEYSTDGTNWATLGATHEFARAPGAAGYAHNTTIDLGGVAAKYVKLTAKSNWGGIFNQYGLSEIRFFYIPVLAREPNPAFEATDINVDNVTISWRAGREAAKHNLYLSDSNQAVIDGTAPVTTVSQASYGPLSFDLGKTYYWRVDEVNEAETPATWQGDVWNFSAQEYLVVDDFEDYNDFEPDRIFDTWIDGWGVPTNGSQVGYAAPPFAERTIVHGGKQSMPLSYDNSTTASYSEAAANVAKKGIGQDWTKYGIKTLSLWFRGDQNNAATEKMYVKLNGSKVTYGGDAANIARAEWQQWNIELALFGVNLRNVTELSIGLERSGAAGGKGKVYFDDIRLYPQREP